MEVNFAARLKQANLTSTNDISDFVKKTDFGEKIKNYNKRITSDNTKHVLAKMN